MRNPDILYCCLLFSPNLDLPDEEERERRSNEEKEKKRRRGGGEKKEEDVEVNKPA